MTSWIYYKICIINIKVPKLPYLLRITTLESGRNLLTSDLGGESHLILDKDLV